jgi:transposase-like protein
MNQLKKGGRRSRHDLTFIRQVVAHYQTGQEGYGLTARRFNVAPTTVREWVLRFSSDLGPVISPLPMTPSEQQELEALRKIKKELEKKLEQANMQIFGLQTLIDVAEESLNIDIRKKPGSKQSKK